MFFVSIFNDVHYSMHFSLALSALLVLHGYKCPTYDQVWATRWYSPVQFKEWVATEAERNEPITQPQDEGSSTTTQATQQGTTFPWKTTWNTTTEGSEPEGQDMTKSGPESASSSPNGSPNSVKRSGETSTPDQGEEPAQKQLRTA